MLARTMIALHRTLPLVLQVQGARMMLPSQGPQADMLESSKCRSLAKQSRTRGRNLGSSPWLRWSRCVVETEGLVL